MCFTVCLTFINQRGWKLAHGRNGFAPETSEGQFWLCSELCGVGLGSSMDNTVISLKPAIKCCFLLHEPGNTFYTACTNHCSGLCFPGCSTALGLLFCSSVHIAMVGTNITNRICLFFIVRYFPMAVLWLGFLVSCFLSPPAPPPTSLYLLLAYIPAQKFPAVQPV